MLFCPSIIVLPMFAEGNQARKDVCCVTDNGNIMEHMTMNVLMSLGSLHCPLFHVTTLK